MTRPYKGPASATETGPSEHATPRKPLASQGSGSTDIPASSGDLLRQLSRSVLDGPRSDAEQRLNDAATQAAEWITRGLCDRTTAATILLVAGQAAGIGQDTALDIIRGALQKAGPR